MAAAGGIEAIVQALRIHVERHEFDRGEFQQMNRLAARGCARIQHPLAGFDAQQRRGQLGTGVLHRYEALRKTRNAGDGTSPFKPNRLRSDLARRHPVRLQHRQIRIQAQARPIHPKRERRCLRGVTQQCAPLLGIVPAQLLHPPGRPVRVRLSSVRLAMQRRQKGFTLALKAPQDGIRKAALAGRLARISGGPPNGSNRLIDDDGGRAHRIDQLHQRRVQDRSQWRCNRSRSEPRQNGLGSAQPAHRGVGHIAHRCA